MRSFRRILAIAASIVIIAAGLGFAAPSRKPRPPLQVSIAPVDAAMTPDRIKPGDIVEFRVTAVSFMNVPEMRIDVDLTGNTKLVAGDTSWHGPAAKNEEKTLTLSVQAPEQGKGAIRASVSFPPSKGASFSAEAEYSFEPEPQENSGMDKQKIKPPVKKDRKGRDVIEYR